jgi:YegS/Rv2252/BmrU family lipid kinase
VKHLFIINPVAGGKKGRADKIEHEISVIADNLSDPYEIYLTKAPMDACRKIMEDAETTDNLRVYACGGDGTLNECANGAALRKNVAITHYPCGTGNDFIRTFGLENTKRFRDIRALINGDVRPLDLIACNDRYGINICSVGIDARVGSDVHKYSKIPIIGGATGYVVALIVNIIKGVVQKFRITTEEGTQDKYISLLCACNGKFYGGGFNPVPEALPDDGQIEFLIINAVSRFILSSIVNKYAKGKYRELSKYISHIQGGSIEVESEQRFVVNIDGEIIYTEKMCFAVVPKGVNFIFPLETVCTYSI